MIKNYIFFLTLLCTSCATRINYLGATFAPTQKVDVYVNEAAIKKGYDILGNGYIKQGMFTTNYIAKLQQKSIQVAKEKGSDAVFITQYYLPSTGTSIQTTSKVDSVGKGIVAVSNTSIQPTSSSGFTINFLKYK